MADKPKDKTKKKAKPKANAPKAALRSEEGSSKPSKEEVDEFVGGVNRFAERLKPHAFKITAVVVLLAAGGIGWAVYGHLQDRKAEKATTVFASAVETSVKDVLPPGEEPDPSTDTNPDEEKPFPTRQARAEATLASLAGSERLGPASELVRARALMDLGRYEDAARSYANAAKGLPAEAAIEARAAIAYSYEARAEATEDAAAREKLLNDAIAAFKDMQPAEDGPKHDAALFHQGRLLAVLGKKDEAIQAYKKVLELHTETVLKTEIEARLEGLGAND